LIARYPGDPRASLARFRLAAHAESAGHPDSAAALYQSEIDASGPQRTAARFWLGKMAEARGDAAQARRIWLALAQEDSVGYYGMRARRETGLAPLAFAPRGAPAPPPGSWREGSMWPSIRSGSRSRISISTSAPRISPSSSNASVGSMPRLRRTTPGRSPSAAGWTVPARPMPIASSN